MDGKTTSDFWRSSWSRVVRIYILLNSIIFLKNINNCRFSLTQIDSFHVEQIKSFLEAFTGWDTNNKYVIKNAAGQQCYYAVEGSRFENNPIVRGNCFFSIFIFL